jgi:hypothetical protein
MPIVIVIGSEPPVDFLRERHRGETAEDKSASEKLLRLANNLCFVLLWRGCENSADVVSVKEEVRLEARAEVSGRVSVHQPEVLPEILRGDLCQATNGGSLSYAPQEATAYRPDLVRVSEEAPESVHW